MTKDFTNEIDIPHSLFSLLFVPLGVKRRFLSREEMFEWRREREGWKRREKKGERQKREEEERRTRGNTTGERREESKWPLFILSPSPAAEGVQRAFSQTTSERLSSTDSSTTTVSLHFVRTTYRSPSPPPLAALTDCSSTQHTLSRLVATAGESPSRTTPLLLGDPHRNASPSVAEHGARPA